MPAFVLGNAIAGVIMRHTRSAMLQALQSDYVRTARAKGLEERSVVLKHAMRNALTPVITLGALEFGTLLSGAVLTEQIFTIPGFGKLIVDAVFNRDYAVVQGVVLVTATTYIIAQSARRRRLHPGQSEAAGMSLASGADALSRKASERRAGAKPRSPAIPNEANAALRRAPPGGWRRLVRRRGAMVGLAVIVLVILVAVFAPLVAPYDPAAQSWSAVRKAPSAAYWLGTDEVGRDLLSRIIFGARASLLGRRDLGRHRASRSACRSGSWPAMPAGSLDGLISRITDAMLACPFLILAIALAAFLGPSLTNAMIAIGVTATPIFVRLTRGQVLSVKAEDYVEAARAVGNPHWRIAFRHILPNVMPALLVQATLTIATAVIAEASLSFLGLGQQPPAPSWGSMLNAAQRFLVNAPWMAVWPGLAIFVTVLSFNLLGDGLRDALDPRSSR